MALTMQQKKTLRGMAHPLKPVIIIGQRGLSEGLMKELNDALNHHELIKIKITAGDREERQAIMEATLKETGAELVHRIGRVFVVYRPAPDEKKRKVSLPDG